jgi:hypothetical protein
MKYFFFLCFLLVLQACKPAVPKNILPPAKMQAILWDMMRADEMVEYYSPGDSAFAKLLKNTQYYQVIFRMHKTTEAIFKASMHFYIGHPKLFQPVLDSMQASADRLEKASDTSTAKFRKHLPDNVKKSPLPN